MPVTAEVSGVQHMVQHQTPWRKPWGWAATDKHQQIAYRNGTKSNALSCYGRRAC